MLGRKPRLPIDTVFESARKEVSRPAQVYLQDMQERIVTTRKIVDDKTKMAKEKQKKYYDRKAKVVEMSVGDRVLVRRKVFDRKHKIEDRFENEVYHITEQPRPDIPVYKVEAEGNERTLHRNLLFLIDNQGDQTTEDTGEDEYVPVIDQDVSGSDKCVSVSGKDTEESGKCNSVKNDVVEDEDSDSDEEGYAVGVYQRGDAHG